MLAFTPEDISALDGLWRSVPADHVWTGWSAHGDTPTEIILYRTRAHWRKFPLRKSSKGFEVFDEHERVVARARTLTQLLDAVEAIPGLNEDYEA